ncbi:7-cyano-7-deazaguanine/7-aminomethyl-7-deazaguanine transporter [Celerinatantimonas sp. MCCC 1A17872]|uniref:7-cyano-7-deazaguanine/7-aminomethyl-7- deazaguanine transporter n=1 Tax=Celerinatantimonas sp. MCCC 1A17872 TaxID=3177514 RepID=UPI0038C7F753
MTRSIEKQLRFYLTLTHIFLITLSNFLVQHPMTLLHWQSTWSAFCFPFIFIVSDLTVRFYGYKLARTIVAQAMFPALIISYLITSGFDNGHWQGLISFSHFNQIAGRIALASFSAYLAGQLLDIMVFRQLRKLSQWWAAPAGSAIVGNLADTFIFFSVAFYASHNTFMATHWVSIAEVDYVIKLVINIILFLPLYGVLLAMISRIGQRFGIASIAH